MTPPKKKAKYEELVIVDVAKGPPPSKAQQVVSCSQSSRSRHAVVDLRAYSITKRALEKKREKEK